MSAPLALAIGLIVSLVGVVAHGPRASWSLVDSGRQPVNVSWYTAEGPAMAGSLPATGQAVRTSGQTDNERPATQGGTNAVAGGGVPRVAGDLAVMRAPSISVNGIRQILRQYGSPAVDDADAMYELGVRYGIDPAICLAFFIVESSAGTRGMAVETRSVGNIRATAGYVNHRGYRKYSSWREGMEDWYRLITRLYVQEWKLTTVDAIVPVYAPAEDNNDPGRYSATVRRLVNEWRQGGL